MCSKCCGNCIYAWGEQWHNSVDGVKYEYYCAQEKDDRGDLLNELLATRVAWF